MAENPFRRMAHEYEPFGRMSRENEWSMSRENEWSMSRENEWSMSRENEWSMSRENEWNAHELLNNLHIPRGIPTFPPSVGVLQIGKDTLVVYYKGGGMLARAVATDPYICPIYIPFVVYWGSVSVRKLRILLGIDVRLCLIDCCEVVVDGMIVGMVWIDSWMITFD
ncbi:hypothetical protein E3N88_11755 [Mikania micrantha]|uniref:Uncharacterized protein n=1 Tax=Mikania micrantha TaxID=192012 RepID=A0A5N6P686_9ASTR|nr:hypothetical protein E3N88_11755 [Mikania micrantha]